MTARAVNLVMDSGAYSAWRSGDPIDLAAYADYIETVADSVDWYVNLDVIPGDRGSKHPSTSQVEEAAKQGWKNYCWLRKRGFNPLPVFHRGERVYWLEKILDSGTDFIGLGGIAFGALRVRTAWLDQVFSFLCGDRGWPPVKIHGFGVASPSLMISYPWYSVDTTSWRTPAVYGKIYIPRQGRDGQPEYDTSPRIVIVNDRQRKKEFGNPKTLWKKMGPANAKHCQEYINSLGFNFLEDRNDDQMRRRMLLRYLHKITEEHKPKPFQINGVGGFFRDVSSFKLTYRPRRLRIYVGIGDLNEDEAMLREEGITDRLISYLELGKMPVKTVRRFVSTGLVPPKEKP